MEHKSPIQKFVEKNWGHESLSSDDDENKNQIALAMKTTTMKLRVTKAMAIEATTKKK